MKASYKPKVGFIGLGLMGKPMALNILKKGFPLAVYNRTENKTHDLKKLGAQVFASPKSLASQVDIIITMVTGPKDVFEVLLGKFGVSRAGKQGLAVIDMSTIGPRAAIEIGQKLRQKGIEFLDAPVTGSTYKAISGELTIFIGGNQQAYEKIKPILQAMGTNLQYMGPIGSGQAIKLVNNLIVAACASALAQGFVLGKSLGLKAQLIADALADVPALSPFMKFKLPNMVKNEYPTAFSVANMYKDLKLALLESKKRQKKMPLLELLEKFYQKSVKKGLKDEDMSAVVKVL